MTSMSFPDLQAGAEAMLLNTAAILNKYQTKYIVVGGWSPFLLNSHPLQHPGTKDVDVLFEKGYDKYSLEQIIKAFLENGFILSAKHEFQLFRQIDVKGQKFIYNLDLLHPLETVKPKDIYVEHIDLNIPASKYFGSTFGIKSIALPSSQALFSLHLYEEYLLKIQTEAGEILQQPIHLMNELGTLITKSKSVLVDKRYRDSLDIFLAIHQCRNYESLIASINQLRVKSRNTYNTMYGIRDAFETGILIPNIMRFHKLKPAEITEIIKRFILDSGLVQPAEEEYDKFEEEIE